MTFNELVLTTEQATESFDSLFNQCVMFAEASYQEYKTNLKEAELKVIQESGTSEDLIYLENAAKEGFLVRAGKTIKKMINSLLTWIKKVIESIQGFLNKKENKEALDKAEKIIKENPKAKNEKIELPDLEKVEKVNKKYNDAVNRKLAMFKAKKFTENDEKELEEIEKNYEKENDAALKLTITVSAATAVALLTLLLPKLQKIEKEVEDTAKNELSEQSNADDVQKSVHATTIKARLMSELTSIYNKYFQTVFKRIKSKFGKMDEIEPKLGQTNKQKSEDKAVGESTIDEQSYLDCLFNEIEEAAEETALESEEVFDAAAYLEALESTLPSGEEVEAEPTFESTEDLEAYLEALEKEICMENTVDELEEYTESEEVMESEMVTAEEYLEYMEAELFSDEDDEVTTESEEDEELTAEEYLEALESALFDESEEDEGLTAEEYLEALESALFEE